MARSVNGESESAARTAPDAASDPGEPESEEPKSENPASPDPYRELFERSADAILIIEGETFVDCNRATVEMLRYTDKEQLLQTHPSELSPPSQPDGRPSFEKANEMIEIARRHGSHRFEWDHKRADGEVFPVEVLLTAVNRGNQQVLHVVWRDITARKQLEAELRQSQKMEAIGRLAGGIAHDFNNLLIAILGHSELLERGVRGDEDPARRHIVEIRRAAERASTLVSQLLTFSRKQVLQPRILDINERLADLGSLLARLIGEDVEVRFELTPEPLLVEVDQSQLEQVVINLVTNARDAMKEGGALTLETRSVEVEDDHIGSTDRLKGGRYAVLSVRDTGCGIEADVLTRIFDPFFTTKPMGRGTGLGLATVYGIAEQSGGGVEARSEVGRGTTVNVFLPLVDAESTRVGELGREHGALSPRPATESILLVEDEQAVGALIEDVLLAAGYTVRRARDGVEAVQLVADEGMHFDLLLTDVVMPRMGGPELARNLRSRHPDLKVLFASGYTDDALSERGLLDGGAELLNKPFSPSTLLERVRRVLDG